MLHLHERREPAAFDEPAGYVRTPICAITGHAPAADCAAVVYEWVLPEDLAGVRRPLPLQLGREYDAWLAFDDHRAPVRGLRIVFPHDGDVFVAHAGGGALERREQQLAFRAAAASGTAPPVWSVNGNAVPLDASGTAFWPLRLGTWTIVANDGPYSDRVTIHVVPPRAGGEPGFTFLRPERYSRYRR
jgi:penicillin-binding protein 1C